MDARLGYLGDQNLPVGLVHEDCDIKKTDFGKTILDKLSKVKGEKVRKTLLSFQIVILEQLPPSEF